jgi:hypothetical protein
MAVASLSGFFSARDFVNNIKLQIITKLVEVQELTSERHCIIESCNFNTSVKRFR